MPLAVGTVSGYNESDYAERISIMINGEKFRRRKLALGILLTLFAVFLQSISFGLSVQAKEEKGRTIRVAYPIQGGLTEKDKQGNYSGYSYDYLQEIAQYTGWNYEFVEVEGDINTSLTKLMDMLNKGEVDLMGGMVYNDQLAETYDYPGYAYGTAYNTLCVEKDNADITEVNLTKKENLKIAVFKNADERNKELKDYCTMNGIEAELLPCESEEEMKEAVLSGRADLVLYMDLSMDSQFRAVAKFAPRPYYFATTKGNTDLVNELNSAILKIQETNPYLSVTLYDKYFGSDKTELLLTTDELNYIKNAKSLDAVIFTGRAPLQYAGAGGKPVGVSKDMLEYISDKTGLHFQYIAVDSYDEYKKMLQEGKVDLTAGILYNYSTAKNLNVALTTSYLNMPNSIVLGHGLSPQDIAGKKLALSRESSLQDKTAGKVVRYDTVEKCLKAVESGEADYSYVNDYSLQYYTNALQLKNVSSYAQSQQNAQKLCIGVVKPADQNLISIINKVIQGMPESLQQAMVYDNAFDANEVSILYIIKAHPWGFAAASIVIIVIIGVIILHNVRSRMLMIQKIAFENEKYMQLSKLMGERIFDYSYENDVLILSEELAEFLNSESRITNLSKKIEKVIGNDENRDFEFYRWLMKQQEGREELYTSFGKEMPRWYRIVSRMVKNKNGEPLNIVGKITDIQTEVEEKERLIQEAQMDSLTQIYNSACSKEQVGLDLECGIPGALWVIDVDHFKTVNDSYGHYQGDEVLIHTAGILKSIFRKDDIVGRLGGDEFIVYMKGKVNERTIRDKYSEYLEVCNGRLKGQMQITFSIGVALSDGDNDFVELYKAADRAMYAVKNKGRNNIEITTVGQEDKSDGTEDTL